MPERRAAKKKPVSQTAQQVAEARAQRALAPFLAALEAERRAATARQTGYQSDLQGFGLAAADMLKGVGTTVNDIYAGAATRQDTYARGLGLGQQLATQNATGEANQLLSQHNAPIQFTAGPEAANVIQGLGSLPAQTLNREGAAFGAAASMLPATAVGRAQQDLLAATRKGEETQQQLAAKRAEIEAQRPGLIDKALQEIRANQSARAQAEAEAARDARDFNLKTNIYAREYGLDVANLELDQTKAGIAARQADARLAQADARIGIAEENARTSRLRLRETQLQNDRNFQTSLDKLGIQEGNLRLRASELEARRRSKAKNGGFTAKQRRDLQQDAAAFAREAYHGWTDDEGNENPPVSYQQAILDMLNEGIPLVVAQRALNRYWSRPGQRGHAGSDFVDPVGGGRPYMKFQNRRRQRPAKRTGK